jgi:hypothetical protein
MLDRADHAANSGGIVVDGNVVRATESERLDGALLVFERVVDRTRLLYENLLFCCHNPLTQPLPQEGEEYNFVNR